MIEYWNISGIINNQWWYIAPGQFNTLSFIQHASNNMLTINLSQNLNWTPPKELYDRQVAECIDWMFHNIFLQIETLNYNSLSVLLRIFTGMLMKCDVNATFLQQLHGAIASSLWKLYWDNRVKDLPF